MLGYVLQNPVQVLAKAALRLLKKQVKSHPDPTAPALNAVVAGLSSPHAALRADLLCWLGTFQPQQFDETTLTQLQDVAAALPPAELAPIAHLLAERPAAPTNATGEEALEGRFDLPAVVDAIQQRAVERPADPLLRRRLAFLEDYLATGRYGELAATVPDHSSALSPPDFALHETAEALALDIAHTQRRVFTQVDYERIFASILRFPQSVHAGRVGAILAPVLAKLEGVAARVAGWVRMVGVEARNCRRCFWLGPGAARRRPVFPRTAWAGSCSTASSNPPCGDG
ncbi:MAG: hypothetical protein MZU95_05550 [Desulfomicrobium escambiense]|nr:hypothetical protein [Desulfomicrobium escambiense]